jgi:hypothetical protein
MGEIVVRESPDREDRQLTARDSQGVDSHGSEVDSGAMSCKSVASQRGQEPVNTEAEESILLGTVTRQRLVKTN